MTNTPKPSTVGVGDLVILPYADVRKQHGLPAEVGLAFEDRRNVIRVYFASLDRTFWLEAEQLQSVSPERLPVPNDVLLIHRLAQRVHADLIDLHDQTPTTTTWFVFSVGGTLEDFTAIPSIAGERLVTCHIEPASMRRVRVRLALATAAGSATPHDAETG